MNERQRPSFGRVLVESAILTATTAAISFGVWYAFQHPELFRTLHMRIALGTKEFAQAVISRVGQKPNRLKAVSYGRSTSNGAAPSLTAATPSGKAELQGIDVFVLWPSRNPNALADAVGKLAGDGLSLQMIDNRGVKVWPAGLAETFCTDNFRCRFIAPGVTKMGDLIGLLQRLSDAGLEIAMTESLRSYDGRPGFSLAQGQ